MNPICTKTLFFFVLPGSAQLVSLMKNLWLTQSFWNIYSISLRTQRLWDITILEAVLQDIESALLKGSNTTLTPSQEVKLTVFGPQVMSEREKQTEWMWSLLKKPQKRKALWRELEKCQQMKYKHLGKMLISKMFKK